MAKVKTSSPVPALRESAPEPETIVSLPAPASTMIPLLNAAYVATDIVSAASLPTIVSPRVCSLEFNK